MNLFKRISIAYFLILFCVNLIALDNNSFDLTKKSNPSPGYIFMSPAISQQFYLIDNTGNSVFIKKNVEFDDFINPKLQPNGLVSFYSGTKYYVMNYAFEIVDSFSCVGDYEVDFHDFIMLPNGNVAMLGKEKKVMDLSKIVNGGQKNANVIGNIIQELDPNKNLVFHWSSFDHFQITDVTSDVDLTQNGILSCHMNSIFYDADGNIIVSSRDLDEITKIDRNNGNIIWRLGGKECKNNQFLYLNDTLDGFFGFSHQHSVTRLPNGNLLIFDNGDMKPAPYSRAVEYKLDETNKTIEKFWEYKESPSVSTFAMGSVQRLIDGNTLIGWGINTRNLTAVEVKPDGTKTLELIGYQNYAVYKYIYKMNAVTLNINKTGNYDFNLDTNKTSVKLAINSIQGDGLISVEKHYYKPHNLIYSGLEPSEILPARWVLTLDSNRGLNAVIKFFVSNKAKMIADNYSIFYRPNEGVGEFTALETNYNSEEECYEAIVNGYGEFIIGIPTSIKPPIGLYPKNGEIGINKNARIIWQPASIVSNYRIQISSKPDFSVLIIDTSNIIDTFYNINLNYNSTYYWHVRSFFDEKQSAWSQTKMFVTQKPNKVDDEIINDYQLFVFSNSDNISFKLGNYYTGNYLLKLYDLKGYLITETSGYYNDNIDSNLNLSVHELNDGIILYKLLIGNQILSGKFFINN